MDKFLSGIKIDEEISRKDFSLQLAACRFIFWINISRKHLDFDTKSTSMILVLFL